MEAYYRLRRNLRVGDIQEVLFRILDDEDALDELKEASHFDTLNREAIAAVWVDALEMYCREFAREAEDGKDMVDGYDRRQA